MFPGRCGRRGALFALCLAGCASIPVTRTVFIDTSGDGRRQRGEPPVPDAVVGFERTSFVRTNASGDDRFDMFMPGGPAGLVWVRVPERFWPGPVWRRVDALTGLDLGLVPLTPAEAMAPVTFVVAADAHVTSAPADPWDGGDLDAALAQLLDLPAPPRLFTIVGDIARRRSPKPTTRPGGRGVSQRTAGVSSRRTP